MVCTEQSVVSGAEQFLVLRQEPPSRESSAGGTLGLPRTSGEVGSMQTTGSSGLCQAPIR